MNDRMTAAWVMIGGVVALVAWRSRILATAPAPAGFLDTPPAPGSGRTPGINPKIGPDGYTDEERERARQKNRPNIWPASAVSPAAALALLGRN